jgi:hypothetical protein
MYPSLDTLVYLKCEDCGVLYSVDGNTIISESYHKNCKKSKKLDKNMTQTQKIKFLALCKEFKIKHDLFARHGIKNKQI